MGELNKKILVIDDDELILSSIKKQLKNENYEIDFINDPIKGLEFVFCNKYDLVLSDIKMKPILGIEVLEKIKQKIPELPVIMITGFVDEKLMLKARELGCSDYLIKPIKKSVLIDTLKKVLTG